MKDLSSTENTTTIRDLNDDMAITLHNYLPLKDSLSFAQTNKRFNSLWYQSVHLKTMFTQLQQAILDNKPKEVKRLLNIWPKTLLEPGVKISTESAILQRGVESKLTWQRFLSNKTPLQIALIRNQVKMIQLILPYFKQLANGPAEALKQWDSAEETIQKQRENTKKHISEGGILGKVAGAILNETFPHGRDLKSELSATTEAVLKEFREIVLPDKAVDLDDYIDVEQFLMAAYQAYQNHFGSLQPSDDKCKRFGTHVIGYLQSVVNPEIAIKYCIGDFITTWQEEIDMVEVGSYYLHNRTLFYRSSCDDKSGLGFKWMTDTEMSYKQQSQYVSKPTHSLQQYFNKHLIDVKNNLREALQKQVGAAQPIISPSPLQNILNRTGCSIS